MSKEERKRRAKGSVNNGPYKRLDQNMFNSCIGGPEVCLVPGVPEAISQAPYMIACGAGSKFMLGF